MTARRPRRKPGENRERLLKAGLIEFGLFGYHGTSTAAVAARAEVPQPHVYANFTTKQSLFLACVDEAVKRVSSSSSGDCHTHDLSYAISAEALVFQAAAAARDSSLEPQIGALLAALRADLGEPAMQAMLGRAWAHLTRSEAG